MWTYNQSPRTDELYHHGVLGQKWGVRRYQNADGSLTAQGKKRRNAIRNSKTMKDVNEIVSNMNNKDLNSLGITGKKTYLTVDQGEWVTKRILIKNGKKPVAFFDVFSDDRTANIALGVRSDMKGLGYGRKVTEKGMDYINKNLNKWEHVEWNALKSNKASIHLAKKAGFKRWKKGDYTDETGYHQSFIKKGDK